MKKRPNRYWAALLAPLALLALAGALMLHPSGAAMPASSPAAIPVSTDNWGLSFQTEGDCPVGNATAEQLAQIGRASCRERV